MRFEYLVGIRYLRARRRERFVSLIALISLIGVAIGTFALTVVLAIMSGLQEDLRDRLLAFSPQITVTAAGATATNLPRLQRAVAAMPGVTGVAPFISSQVMVGLDHRGRRAGLRLRWHATGRGRAQQSGAEGSPEHADRGNARGA